MTTNRKEAAQTFLNSVVSGNVREAYDRFVAMEFIHHNPHFPGDRESLLVAMEKNHLQFPHKTIEFKHTVEEGDLVVVHSMMRPNPVSPGLILVHVFRFAGDKVVELWDMGQPIPPDSPNENGMF
jgi:predicted SnoaL-like aldol condensation-catalyzing enzyme